MMQKLSRTLSTISLLFSMMQIVFLFSKGNAYDMCVALLLIVILAMGFWMTRSLVQRLQDSYGMSLSDRNEFDLALKEEIKTSGLIPWWYRYLYKAVDFTVALHIATHFPGMNWIPTISALLIVFYFCDRLIVKRTT